MAKQKEWKSPADKKKKKNYWAIGILFFMVIGLSGGFVFHGYSGSGQSERVNGVKVSFKGQYWGANIDGVEAAFTHPPSVVDYITVDPNVLGVVANKIQFDATSVFNDTSAPAIAQAQYQMGLTLHNYGVFVRQGFTNNQSGFAQITCDTANAFVPVLLFETANETSITAQNNCVSVKARSPNEMIMVKDRLLYLLLGVM